MAGMRPPARVALLAHLLSGEASYRSAGIHSYLYHSISRLPEVAPDLAFTLFVGSDVLPARSDWVVRRSRMRTGNPMARILWEQLAAPVALRAESPDLVHGTAFALPLLWPGPSVVTIYDLSFLRHPGRLGKGRQRYLRWITAASARRARRVIAISQSGRTEIANLLGIPSSRIAVALPGVASHFRPHDPAQKASFRIRCNLPERFVLYVGTLEPRKNLEVLVRAWAMLPQRRQIGLVLAGAAGWQTGALLKLIEDLGVRSEVILPGYIASSDLPMWYNAAEIFAYPSVYEGFGLPLLEAMACGVPVLAANTTSLPEAVGEDGILLPPADHEAWSRALAGLLEDTERQRELAARGIQRARGFSWENTARSIAAAYRHVLGSSDRDE